LAFSLSWSSNERVHRIIVDTRRREVRQNSSGACGSVSAKDRFESAPEIRRSTAASAVPRECDVETDVFRIHTFVIRRRALRGQPTVGYSDAGRRGTRVSDVFPAFLSFLLYEQVSRSVQAHLPAAQCKRVILLLRVVCLSVRLSAAGVPLNKSTPNNASRLVAIPLLVCRSPRWHCVVGPSGPPSQAELA